MARENVVRALATVMNEAALDAMGDTSDISLDELFSAQLTLVATTLVSLRNAGVPPRWLRAGVEKLLLRCADEPLGRVN